MYMNLPARTAFSFFALICNYNSSNEKKPKHFYKMSVSGPSDPIIKPRVPFIV